MRFAWGRAGGVVLLQVGDTVVYPMHGAGVISGIEDCEVLGEGKSYYVLQMPLGNMKVMIPTDNVDNMGLRDVIPETQVEEVKPEGRRTIGFSCKGGAQCPKSGRVCV